MRVFIDESGDTGKSFASSQYFILAAVIFDNDQQATTCARSMINLAQQCHLTNHFEFHFNHNSHQLRQQLLRTIKNFDFQYSAIIIDKSRLDFHLPQFKNKTQMYSFALQQVLATLPTSDVPISITLDRCGNDHFCRQLAKTARVTTSNCLHALKLKQRDSDAETLLQLADYTASILHTKILHKSCWAQFYQQLASHERAVITYPLK